MPIRKFARGDMVVRTSEGYDLVANPIRFSATPITEYQSPAKLQKVTNLTKILKMLKIQFCKSFYGGLLTFVLR